MYIHTDITIWLCESTKHVCMYSLHALTHTDIQTHMYAQMYIP